MKIPEEGCSDSWWSGAVGSIPTNFVPVTGILWGIEVGAELCAGNPVACTTWGAGNPLVSGYCCVLVMDRQAVGCSGNEVVACTPSASHCGQLVPITFTEDCRFSLNGRGCGGGVPATGCISGGCAAVPGP
jgi:hypothetical protein